MRSLALIIIVAVAAGFGFMFIRDTPAPEPTTISAINSVPDIPLVAQAYLLPLAQPTFGPFRDRTASGSADPVIDASAAIAVHLESDTILFSKNEYVRLPIASLTKILTALVATELFDMGDVVTVSSASVRVDGIKTTLAENQQIIVRDLIGMMLVESSNDAAYALAQRAKERGIDFVSAMNITANRIGIGGCHFTDPAGLDDQAYCNARDLVRLVQAINSQASGLWTILGTSKWPIHDQFGVVTREATTTNELLYAIPGVLGGKTGNTDGALGCMMLSVQLPNNRGRLVTIVLGSRQRFADTRALVEWVSHAYQWP